MIKLDNLEIQITKIDLSIAEDYGFEPLIITKKQAKQLIPILKMFVKKGEI